MSASINWQGGLDDLARELETLPDKLLEQVIDPVMDRETDAGASNMRAAYGHESLANGVKRDKRALGDYRIRNTNPVAHLNELGTVARFRANGAPTGIMPAKPVMIPEAIATRERISAGVEKDVTKLRSPHLEVKP